MTGGSAPYSRPSAAASLWAPWGRHTPQLDAFRPLGRADGYGWLVGYDYVAGRSQPLPDDVRERLEPELRDPVG